MAPRTVSNQPILIIVKEIVGRRSCMVECARR